MKLASVLGLCLTVLVALVAAGVSAQTMTSPNATSSTTATPVVLNIVEITRLVPSGTTAVTAFTVPAGQTLIVTDALVTNTGTAATCGAAINRAGGTAAAVTTPAATTATGTTTTTPTTTGTTATAPGTVSAGVPALAGTLTQTDSTITGPLCIAARTTTPLPCRWCSSSTCRTRRQRRAPSPPRARSGSTCAACSSRADHRIDHWALTRAAAATTLPA